MAQIEAPPSRLSVSASLPLKSVVGKSLDTSNYRSVASTRLSTPQAQALKSVDHDRSLSPISVEKRLRSALRKKSNDVLAAFRTYDLDGSATVTKGELRRVLELFCFPLTSEQFDALLAKVATSANGAVRFVDFLADFADVQVQEQSSVQPLPESDSESNRECARPESRASGRQLLGNANVDLIERLLRERANGNLRGLMKAMQLFDYNRDHKIQRHELRKVIENYCALRLTDAQFDKLWTRYDFYHTGAIDYMDFLRRIGVGVTPSNTLGHSSRPSSVLSVASDNSVRSLQRPATTLSPPHPLNDSRSQKLASIAEQGSEAETFETLHDMERAFRARFKKQVTAIRKAFIAFDTQRDGFVELDDLKAVLREFAMPSLSDAHFAELMRRANIKANGRVPWRSVLSKFEHPLSELRNGQTLPIRNDTHHFNPVMGASESVALERLLNLLHEQVRSGYSSFKEAFLQIDFNRDGKISRSELRKVLERFKIRVNDEQFTQLLAALGMNDTKTISYHRFLEIFEPKEAEDHKWLNSVHRFNSSQKPLLLAWRTVEELLCSRLKNNWKEVMKAIGLVDVRNSGLIGVDQLRAIVERYAFPVSADHFDSLLSRSGEGASEDGDSKQVRSCAYDVFFERLGVNADPDDTSGVSATIIAHSEVVEREHVSIQLEKRRELDAALDNRIRIMTADELLVRLKDHLMLRNEQLFDAFQAVAQRSGALQRRDVRKLLAHIGVQLEDAAYSELLSRLRFRPDGTMTYADFVATFAQRPGDNYGMGARLEEAANHRVNPARGDQRGLDVDALERRLREKLSDNFADLRAAFRKLDESHSGTIDRAAFRKLLDSFMCVTSEAEFNKLATRFGLASRGARIDYLRFLQQFQSRDEPGAHRWLDSVHRTQAAREPGAITAEQAHRFLVEKAYSQFHDLRGAFCAFDAHSRGYVTRRDLAELLNRFQLQLAQGEVDRLWLLYDVARNGKINFAQFVDALRFAQQFAPPDLGASHSIALNNRHELLRHADTQTHLQQQLTNNQVRVGESLPLAEVMRRLTDTLHLRHADLQTAFRKCDSANKGYLNVADFVRVLEQLYLYLTEDQLADLLVLFGVPSNDSHISYVQFLSALERHHFRTERNLPAASVSTSSPPTPSEAPTPSQTASSDSQSPQSDADANKLSPGDAEARLRRAVQTNVEALHKALRAFDRLASGTVRVTELRRVLDTFCFVLTDFHFRHVLWRSRSCLVGASLEAPPSGPTAALPPLSADLRINYNEFLATFGKQHKIAQSDWLRELPRTEPVATPVSVEEVEARIREFVAMRGALLRRAFRDADYAQLGVVSRDDFVRVLRRFVMRVTDQQAAALFQRNFAPENEFGNILYDEFLARHGFIDAQTESTSGVDSERPRGVDEAVGQTERSAVQAPEPQAPRAPSTVSTLLSAERVERQIRAALGGSTSRKWDDLQAEFRSLDSANTGEVERGVFLAALERFSSINIDPSEMQSVLDKYDPQSTGKFAYRSFLRNLLLTVDEPADNERAALRRKLIKSKMTVFASGDKSEQFFEAMLRIRARILAEWKPLRRAFRERDARHTGQISSLDFRAVLKKFQIVLSEEEFYHFTAYFDRSLESRVNYDEFIRTFLETA